MGVSLDPHITIVTMKFLALTAVLLAAAQAKTIQLKMDAPPDHLEYGFCEGSPEPATIDVADVQPFPVIIKQGQEISLEVQVTLNEEVAVGATVDLKLVLEGLIPVKIPCLDIDGHNIGSCSYDADFLLEQAEAAGLCPQYVPDGQECKLPLAPGVFGGGDPSLSQSKTPSQTSSSPSSREPSGQRPQPRTPAATCSPVSGSGSPWIISKNKEFQIFRNI